MERIKKYEPLWGKWKVKKKLGEGSFGAVYEVESQTVGNTSSCAVKFISFKNTEMLQGVKNIATLSSEELKEVKMKEAKKNVREAVLMEKLQGRDHIVTIYDYDIFPGEKVTDVIIRMELLINMRDYIRNIKIDSAFVVRLGIDICKALEECEAEKIVHRDIKPDNIFANKNGSFKLGDFGLSRKMSKSASFSLRKSAGTPLYMAPEAFGWGEKIDNQSDIYSLGMVMYQLANNGKLPFVNDMENFEEVDEAIGKRVSGEEIVAPENIEEEVWSIIQKASRFKKEERYLNAYDMRKELEAIQNKESKKSAEKNKHNKSLTKKMIPVSCMLIVVVAFVITLAGGGNLKISEKKIKTTENTFSESKSETTTETSMKAEADDIKIYNTPETVLVGDLVNLRLKADGWVIANNSWKWENIQWSTDDKSVAVIDKSGFFKAKKAGTCNLIAKYADKQTMQKVTVIPELTDSELKIVADYPALSMTPYAQNTVNLKFEGKLPKNLSTYAYCSDEISLQLNWGKFDSDSNSISLTLKDVSEYAKEMDGHVTVFVYDTNKPEEIIATTKIKVKVSNYTEG